MSREVKFRVWDLESQRYGEVRHINYNFEGEIDSVVCWFSVHEREVYLPGGTFIIEQDTGLKDKNGKKIHEGDIVGFYDYYLNEETDEDEPGALEPWGHVIYEDTKARFGVWGDSPFADEEKHFFGLTGVLEVIGNIHENQDLLCDTNVANKEEE